MYKTAKTQPAVARPMNVNILATKSNFPSSASQFSLSPSSCFPITWNTALSPIQIAVAKYKPPQSHFLNIDQKRFGCCVFTYCRKDD